MLIGRCIYCIYVQYIFRPHEYYKNILEGAYNIFQRIKLVKT